MQVQVHGACAGANASAYARSGAGAGAEAGAGAGAKASGRWQVAGGSVLLPAWCHVRSMARISECLVATAPVQRRIVFDAVPGVEGNSVDNPPIFVIKTENLKCCAWCGRRRPRPSRGQQRRGSCGWPSSQPVITQKMYTERHAWQHGERHVSSRTCMYDNMWNYMYDNM